MDGAQIVLVALQYAAFLLALCVHELSHAAIANALGDDTAAREGRITLSPLAHADPLGTVLLPLAGLLFGGGMLFGWAKPTPVQPHLFRRGWFRSGQILVAAGGPLSNLAQAAFWTAAYALLTRAVSFDAASGRPLGLLAIFIEASILVNLVLAVFNLLPVPPLDGGHVASWALPREMGLAYDAFMQRAGFVLFIVMLLPIIGGSSIVSFVLVPARLLGWLASSAPVSGWAYPMIHG